MNLNEKTISSREIYSGKIISVRLDRVQLSDGQESSREIVEVINSGAVGIVPVKDGRIYLVRQYRKAIEKVLLEIPAGRLEPGEDPLHCAQRELAEEIGFRTENLQRMAFFYSSPGFSNEVLYLYLARDLVRGETVKEEGEFLEVESYAFPEALKMVSNGEIEDGKTIIGLLMAANYLSKMDNQAG
ncbi:MAG: NUDIX hydrolase [Firmicutes bacterium]|jgi:ADP-ribose pyrophosphatase|nr:NUDIX hydrolase [Bacillota bacterium]